MKESTRICVVFTVAVAIVSIVSVEVAGYPMLESGPNNGPYVSNGGVPMPLQPNPGANIKDLQFTPGAQNAFDQRMRLYLLNWLQNTGYPMERLTKVKKSCLINAGLSHGCDYKDTLNAIQEVNEM